MQYLLRYDFLSSLKLGQVTDRQKVMHMSPPCIRTGGLKNDLECINLPSKIQKFSEGRPPYPPLSRLTVMSHLHLYTSCTECLTQGALPPNQCIRLQTLSLPPMLNEFDNTAVTRRQIKFDLNIFNLNSWKMKNKLDFSSLKTMPNWYP